MMPRGLRQPGGLSGVSVNVSDTRATFLVQQLHALAEAIYQAKLRNDKADAAALLVRFRSLADQYRSLGSADLSPFDNFIVATGQWIEQSVDAIPDALAALPTAVGTGLIKAAIPFAVLFAGYILLRNWGRK